MSKPNILVVDGDPQGLRLLQAMFQEAGFVVTTAMSGKVAMDLVAEARPDVVIAEVALHDLDGFELCRQLKSTAGLAGIPFVFVTKTSDVDAKVRGLEMGAADYLTTPISARELVTRVRLLLKKLESRGDEGGRDGRTRFVGRLSELPLVDLIQTVEISRKSGFIQFHGEGERQAIIYFRDGRVIDAEDGALVATDAVYRLLTWPDGDFEVRFCPIRRRDVITDSSQAVLMEGMRRLDEWRRMCRQLPALDARLDVDAAALFARLAEIPDEYNAILRLCDGYKTTQEVIDATQRSNGDGLGLIARLYSEGLLVQVPDVTPRDFDSAEVGAVAIGSTKMRVPGRGRGADGSTRGEDAPRPLGWAATRGLDPGRATPSQMSSADSGEFEQYVLTFEASYMEGWDEETLVTSPRAFFEDGDGPTPLPPPGTFEDEPETHLRGADAYARPAEPRDGTEPRRP